MESLILSCANADSHWLMHQTVITERDGTPVRSCHPDPLRQITEGHSGGARRSWDEMVDVQLRVGDSYWYSEQSALEGLWLGKAGHAQCIKALEGSNEDDQKTPAASG
jgi:hypothetical protein